MTEEQQELFSQIRNQLRDGLNHVLARLDNVARFVDQAGGIEELQTADAAEAANIEAAFAEMSRLVIKYAGHFHRLPPDMPIKPEVTEI